MADSSADGRFYACATQQGRVVFGLTESQAVLRTFYVCEPQAIALTADGRFLAVAGKGGGSPAAIHVWDLKGGSLLASFRTVVTNDSLLKFSPNGEFLADTIPQGVEVWAVQRGERISIHPVVGKVAYLGFLDNQTVIIIREDGKVESFTMQ